MSLTIRSYRETDIAAMRTIWNGVVREGAAFPQMEELGAKEAAAFFAEQTGCRVAVLDEEVVGLYILHPNNVGRCGHIANTSYAVKESVRGMKIGEQLVRDSLQQAKAAGFRLLQFNAVVASNAGAIHLYEKLGFKRLGIIPGGFMISDGVYEDILPFYIELEQI